MGIIDILTHFGCMKSVEYMTKMIKNCNQQASCVPPEKYKKRFVDFLKNKCFYSKLD